MNITQWLKKNEANLYEEIITNKKRKLQNSALSAACSLCKEKRITLAGVALWTECWPVNRKVVDSIPGEGTCLGCGLVPFWGCVGGNSQIFLSYIDVLGRRLTLYITPFWCMCIMCHWVSSWRPCLDEWCPQGRVHSVLSSAALPSFCRLIPIAFFKMSMLLIFGLSLFLLPSIFPSIIVSPKEPCLLTKWPK